MTVLNEWMIYLMSIKKSRDSFHDTFKKSISWGSWRVYEKLAVSTIWNYILMLSCVLCFSYLSYFFIDIYFLVSLPMLLLGVKTGWQEIFSHPSSLISAERNFSKRWLLLSFPRSFTWKLGWPEESSLARKIPLIGIKASPYNPPFGKKLWH